MVYSTTPYCVVAYDGVHSGLRRETADGGDGAVVDLGDLLLAERRGERGEF